eukprot:CAMPEP_0119502160 /NCGR_PEP_ID=MMETSP1344-20130328/23735_1 /TAXON_ID=236787 /ORGANISM="Florenciella parvula, Strain CCMP2471" /LENGTH=70 /DNA_ID=CAMNT_0007538361 /DNA_START=207 /DNA_END=416 /DNA_ORIENTATION=-
MPLEPRCWSSEDSLRCCFARARARPKKAAPVKLGACMPSWLCFRFARARVRPKKAALEKLMPDLSPPPTP